MIPGGSLHRFASTRSLIPCPALMGRYLLEALPRKTVGKSDGPDILCESVILRRANLDSIAHPVVSRS